MKKYSLLKTKAIEILKYRINNDEYWDKVKLYKQVVSKAFFIVNALYFGYSFLFLFYNLTNYFVYIKDTPQV